MTFPRMDALARQYVRKAHSRGHHPHPYLTCLRLGALFFNHLQSIRSAVTFKDGAATLGVQRLIGGKANLTLSSLTKGTHSITAIYAVTPTWTASESAVLLEVVQ